MKHIAKMIAAVLAGIMVFISIPVTAHAASCSATFEIGTLYSGSTMANVVDFGTIDLSTGELTAQKPVIIQNKSGSIYFYMGVETVYDQYGNPGPFKDEHYGASWPSQYGISQNGWQTNTIYMDVSYLPAGTYTEYFYIDPADGYTLTLNNGAIHADSDGRFRIPVTVTLTGTNPNFAAPVQNLRANAGNGAVELTWDEQTDCVGCEYTLYRMEGVPTGTPGQTTDAWEMIPEEIRQDEPHYIDYDVENGKTYSYTAVVGSIGRGNCSDPVTATPSSSYVQRIEAIETFRAEDSVDGAVLFWRVLVPGQGQIREDIDHFNVYRNGILYAIIDYNGYEEYWVGYNDPDEGYKQDDYNQWEVTFDCDPGAVYCWQVSAVDKNGIEGYLSKSLSAGRIDTIPIIETYSAVYVDDYQTPEDEQNDTERDAVQIYVSSNSVYYGIRYVKVWRDGEYIGQLKGDEHDSGMWVFDYENIQPNTTYTYTIQVIDRMYQESAPVTFYLTTDDEGEAESIYQVFSVKYNTTPSFYVYGERGYTYDLYRNGQLIDTHQGDYEYFYFRDTPDTDGTYVYHVARTKNGRTVTSPDYTYIRNTVPEIVGQKPSAPVLNARLVDDGHVSLSWTPTSAGGSADGYYIYKTRMNGGSEEFRTDQFYKSDGYWSGTYGSEPAQNRYIRLYADKTSYIDTYVQWYNEDWMPTKYWVCAYNQYGISDSSEVIIYEYNEGDAPENNNTEAPGKPVITNVWDIPDPDASEAYVDKARNLLVSWEGPVEGGKEDYFEVVIQKRNSAGQYVDDHFSENTTNDRYLFSGDINLDPGYQYNDVGSFKIIVVAVNTVNGVECRTESDPYYYDLSYPPVLTLAGGTDHIDLTWTDATANATVADYEIWRKSEYGLWEKLAIGQSDIAFDGTAFSCTDSTVISGTTYTYYVLRNKDGKPRASREQTIKPSASLVLPGAPANLNVKRLSGSQMLVSWDAPADGGTVNGYLVQYKAGSGFSIAENIRKPITSYCGSFPSQVIRVVAYNDGGQGPASEEFDISSLPENSASSKPPYVWPHAIVGDATITVTWDYSNYTEENGAQYFQIVRSKNDGEQQLVGIVVADPSLSTYYWTDPDVENGNNYEYWVYPTNSRGYQTYSWNMYYSAFGTPEGPTPNSDQIAAQSVEDLIADLPDVGNLDPTDEDALAQIREVQSVYESLTDEQRQLIDPDERQKMEDLIDLLDQADAEDKYENNAAVANVRALIDALPNADSVTQATDAVIAQAAQARQAYAALPADAKRVVDTTKLDALEQRISQLQRQAADLAAAQNAITAINALPDPSQVTLNNASQVRAQVNNAKVLYESLTPAQKDMFASADGGAAALEKLAGLEAALAMLEVDEADRIAAEAVIALINAIPELSQMTVADESKVVQARTALNALTNKQRNLVPSEYVNKLVSSEARIQLLKDADAVAQLIAQLPAAADVTIDDEAQIEAARTAYEGLSTQAKALVPAASLEKLEAAETAIEEIHQADQQAADAVAAQINALKDAAQLTLADEASVNAAADAYDALTQAQKDLVPASALAKLSAAQDRIAALKAADSVSQLINALPASLTLDDAAQVEAARAAYEDLSDEEKALVPAADLNKLEEAEDRLEELRHQAAADEVSQIISDLPDPAGISVDNADQIHAARAAYDALTDEEKELVSAEMLAELEAAEAALDEAFSHAVGWIRVDGYWYYYVSGVPQTDWQKINGKWYYMDPDTAIMVTGWRKVGGTWYYFNSGGAMVTGWQKIGGVWYYFRDGGSMVTGWQKIGGVWYFFRGGGSMVTGWYNDGGSWYFFKNSGAMAANEWCEGYWLNANGTWTYKPKGSWHKDSRGWWFGDTSGWYAKNTTIKIDGVNYSFNASGYMK